MLLHEASFSMHISIMLHVNLFHMGTQTELLRVEFPVVRKNCPQRMKTIQVHILITQTFPDSKL